MFQFVPSASGSDTEHQGKKPGSNLFVPFLQVQFIYVRIISIYVH